MNSLHEMSENDILRSYGDCWVRGENGRPFFLQAPADGNSAVRGHYLFSDDMWLVPTASINTEMPDLGYFSYKGTIYFASWVAQRQWKRGLKCSRVALYEYDSGLLLRRNLRIPASSLSRILAREFLWKRTPDNRIVNRNTCIVNGQIFYKTVCVGAVQGTSVNLLKGFKLEGIEEWILNRNIA